MHEPKFEYGQLGSASLVFGCFLFVPRTVSHACAFASVFVELPGGVGGLFDNLMSNRLWTSSSATTGVFIALSGIGILLGHSSPSRNLAVDSTTVFESLRRYQFSLRMLLAVMLVIACILSVFTYIYQGAEMRIAYIGAASLTSGWLLLSPKATPKQILKQTGTVLVACGLVGVVVVEFFTKANTSDDDLVELWMTEPSLIGGIHVVGIVLTFYIASFGSILRTLRPPDLHNVEKEE